MKTKILSFAFVLSLLASCFNETVVDVDGNEYKTVKIGRQIWMAENLKVTQAPDSKDIESFCYANREGNCEMFGRLYNWEVAMNGSTKEEAQGICPDGWHLPSDDDWKILEMELGMSIKEINSDEWRGEDQGTQIKKDGKSGFNTLFAGRRNVSGKFVNSGTYAGFWTSSKGEEDVWTRYVNDKSSGIYRGNNNKDFAFSIRCVKNSENE